MADLKGFDASKVQPNDSFSPLPAGEYLCIMTKSEMKPTKAGDGEYLAITYDVVEGQFSGRKIFDRLNLVNKSSQAMDIAQKSLSGICRAVGVLQPSDSAELHDKPLIVAVKIKDDQNEVKGYKPSTTASVTPITKTAAASVGGAKKPWQK